MLKKFAFNCRTSICNLLPCRSVQGLPEFEAERISSKTFKIYYEKLQLALLK
jgi:hypothetical protein